MAGFMKLYDMPGDSKNVAFKEYIRIDSMSSEITREIPESARGNQRAKGHTILNNISVSRQLDRSSTDLQKKVATGDVIKEVKIVFANMYGSTGAYQAYLTYTLSYVVLASYSISCDAEGEDLPKEELTLSYTKAVWDYKDFNEKGEPGNNYTASYDLTTDVAGKD